MELATKGSGCIEDEIASAFLEGALADAEARAVEDHIDRCVPCRRHLAALVKTRRGAATAPVEGEAPIAPGAKLGRYQLRRVLGMGQMGVVYAAHDAELDRDVAVKLVRDGADQRRLIREAHSLARLRHPNVVTVHDVGTDAGRVFIVMELISGSPLSERLRLRPDRRLILRWFIEAARGLHAAHSAGLLHRDFKPDNVLVDGDDRALVTDFGLARPAGVTVSAPAPSHELGTDDAVTRTGALLGTPVYMAPEQLFGGELDARSDQYSFAVALHEAVYGVRPFAGATLVELAANIQEGRTVPTDRRVPRSLAQLIRRGLARDAAARLPSMAAFADELEAALRPRWLIPAVGAALVAVGVASALAARRAPDRCAASAGLVDQVWSVEGRTAILASLTALRPEAGPALASAAAHLDDWAATWRLARRVGCAADPALRASRLGCLDQRLAELRAMLAVWHHGDARTVDYAPQAARELPSPEGCARSAAAPVDRTVGDEVARMRANRAAGRARRTDLDGLLRTAEAVGAPSTLALALNEAGQTDDYFDQLDEARGHFARAAREAGKAGDDELLFDALAAEIRAILGQGRATEAFGLLDAVEALAARAELGRVEELSLLRGQALAIAGKAREGRVEFDRVLAATLVRALRDPGAGFEIVAAENLLGGADLQLAEFAVARQRFDHALVVARPIYGPGSPMIADLLHNLALAEAGDGAPARARADLDAARAIYVASIGEGELRVGTVDASLANLAAQAGDDPAALAGFQRAAATLAARSPDSANLGIVEGNLGTVLGRLDRCGEALAHFDRAVAVLAAAGRAGEDLARAWLNRGACLAELGRASEGILDLHRGIAALESGGASRDALDNAELQLAGVEANAGQRASAKARAQRVLDRHRAAGDPIGHDAAEVLAALR